MEQPRRKLFLPLHWEAWLVPLINRFMPASTDLEILRRAQLFIFFSALGGVFGGLFASFYFAIGHPWGGGIVTVCTLTLLSAPWLVRARGLAVAGNVYALVLVLGFAGLTALEGGIRGHAVAWLAALPLCTAILVDRKMGYWWGGVCLAVVGVFCALEFAGQTPPVFYPARWETAITSAGYLSLTVFLAAFGLLFERGRRNALIKLDDAMQALAAANVQLGAVNEQLGAANAQLRELDQERATFLGIVAHDLRSPLTNILGYTQLLQSFGDKDAELRGNSLATIFQSGSRMRDMLEQLLSQSAIEQGELQLDIQPCDLSAAAARVVEIYVARAQSKGVRLRCEPSPQPAFAEADPQALTQIIDNLVSNAIKFSEPDRPVTVRVTAGAASAGAAPRAMVEVEDHGPGMSEEDQRKLYGRFTRLSARPTAGESSTGLGLSIVKRLAESMGGELACRSQLGMGTTFSLALKLAA